MSRSGQDVAIGQDVEGRDGFSVYTRQTLRNYDLLVHGLSNRLAWKCPTSALHKMYADNCSDNHLEIGVGTGLFLDRLPASRKFRRLVLADPNQECLAIASNRLRRFEPIRRDLNLLQPETFGSLDRQKASSADSGPGCFDSIALNYVIHCLPRGLDDLADFLPALCQRVSSTGVFFGSTILARGYRRNFLATRLMQYYQRQRIFGNEDDSADKLRSILASQFERVTIRQHGCVAMYICSQSR